MKSERLDRSRRPASNGAPWGTQDVHDGNADQSAEGARRRHEEHRTLSHRDDDRVGGDAQAFDAILHPVQPGATVTQNSTHRYDSTVVLGVERIEAPVIVTSAELDDHLSEVYRRTRMRAGLLEGLVGIRERRRWGDDQSFTDGAAAAIGRPSRPAAWRP